VYAPIGLDLGGRTPEETALSIIAEIVAVKNGRSGASLRVTAGPIGKVPQSCASCAPSGSEAAS
jgi:xanthine dehydrogenase accessory factor